MLLLPLLLLLLLLAKKFLAISNSNVEKRAVAADRVDGENTLLDSLANCVPRPPSGPQQHSGQCSSWSTGRGGWQGSDGRGGHSHRHARMQDTGHFWAGTADIAYFSAHTQMHRNMQQAGKPGARKGGKGSCNDADNDLKFIKNSKICVAKNMQLWKWREGDKASASPKTNMSRQKYPLLIRHCYCCCSCCTCSPLFDQERNLKLNFHCVVRKWYLSQKCAI